MPIAEPRSNPIFTIGYEGASAEQVIDALRAHKIEVLLDARFRPASRKRGLSKTPLAEACEAAGIAYRHDRGLGTPPDIMRKLREEGVYDWPAYRAFLRKQTKSLDQACELAASKRICLLCYEADASTCHRNVVAEEIAAHTQQLIEHLAPQA